MKQRKCNSFKTFVDQIRSQIRGCQKRLKINLVIPKKIRCCLNLSRDLKKRIPLDWAFSARTALSLGAYLLLNAISLSSSQIMMMMAELIKDMDSSTIISKTLRAGALTIYWHHDKVFPNRKFCREHRVLIELCIFDQFVKIIVN